MNESVPLSCLSYFTNSSTVTVTNWIKGWVGPTVTEGMDVNRKKHEMYVARDTEARSRNHFCSGKAMSITYFCVSLCVCGSTVAGVCMRACRLTYPTCKAPPYCHLLPLWLHLFSALFRERQNYRKGVAGRKICILIFSITFIWNISHSKKNLAI
jgi:hypothetical protein